MIAEAIVARKLETTGHEILKSIHPTYHEWGCYGSGCWRLWRGNTLVSMIEGTL
jgi:hypothetical protein